METDNEVYQIYELLQKVKVDDDNVDEMKKVNELIEEKEFKEALEILKKLTENKKGKKKNDKKDLADNEEQDVKIIEETVEAEEIEKADEVKENENNDEKDEDKKKVIVKKEENEKEEGFLYPKQLQNDDLERTYIGMLLNDPKLISKFYILHSESYLENSDLLEIYKGILFTEGDKYAPAIAKKDFNFGKITLEVNDLKELLKREIGEKRFNSEKVYLELKKILILRKSYLETPIKTIQDKIADIVNYKLYDKMSEEEVQGAINQVTVTDKFKQSILNEDLTNFLLTSDNNLTNGLELPFPILTSVFKGIRRGETMAFAMPSNSGKSRFTINLASYLAFVHKKKVLIISNEMSEEKMKLCLITTILNNSAFQNLHGQIIKKSEGELLEFKFRPDDERNVEVDENGFVLKKDGETQNQFAKRLSKCSTEFNKTVLVTDWVRKQINNSIYFSNITDHTNDELKKSIMNYYYKEEIHYIFYDTLKTDTENIGNGEEIKKTTTILSNLAQNFELFIGATLQLTESSTLPINLTINDLAVSRTVKEVLDTLCLIKQINRENYDDYEYSINEVDTKFFDLEKFKDPDVRYYACVVDKNRAGAKPKVLFRLNLAYNHWEELGYLKLKHME